jgi:hypothetical protein
LFRTIVLLLTPAGLCDPLRLCLPRRRDCRLVHAEAGLNARLKEASQRAAAAEAAAAEARRRADQLAEEAQDLRDAFK